MKKWVFLIVILISSVGLQAQSDSLGIERSGDQVLVLHRVTSGQTLYALARRYKTNVAAIQSANGGLASGLRVGQTIKIPYGGTVTSQADGAVYHQVAQGETLYAISRKYGVGVNEIKRLNGMSSNALSVGQRIKIKEAAVMNEPEEVEEVTTTETETTEEAVEETTETVSTSVDTTATQTKEPEVEEVEIPVVEEEPEEIPGTPFKEMAEEGIAELISEDAPSNKFLALHKTAPVGTVIKIRNKMNALTVYVRVIGSLPETTENENVIIKINKRAYDQLKALDARFMVELSYFL